MIKEELEIKRLDSLVKLDLEIDKYIKYYIEKGPYSNSNSIRALLELKDKLQCYYKNSSITDLEELSKRLQEIEKKL